MNRFAFLDCQPWLYPSPDARPPLRGGELEDDARLVRVVHADGTIRPLPRHLALRVPPSCDDVPRTPPSRGRVARGRAHPDPSVIFDGCASFHFSEREQYGVPASAPTPPAPSSENLAPPGGGGVSGASSSPNPTMTRNDASRFAVSGAAAPDALHVAFAPDDAWPDQAQLTCTIRARLFSPLGDDESDDRARSASAGQTSLPGSPFAAAAAAEARRRRARRLWLEVVVDGATHALDLSQARHIVAGPPRARGDEPTGNDATTSDAIRREGEAFRRRRRRRPQGRRRPQSRLFETANRRDAPRRPGDDGDDEGSHAEGARSAEARRYERPPEAWSGDLLAGGSDAFRSDDSFRRGRVVRAADEGNPRGDGRHAPRPLAPLNCARRVK